jgi:hypothetical protein
MDSVAKSKRSNIELYNELNRTKKMVSIQDDVKLPFLSHRHSEAGTQGLQVGNIHVRKKAKFPVS